MLGAQLPTRGQLRVAPQQTAPQSNRAARGWVPRDVPAPEHCLWGKAGSPPAVGKRGAGLWRGGNGHFGAQREHGPIPMVLPEQGRVGRSSSRALGVAEEGRSWQELVIPLFPSTAKT